MSKIVYILSVSRGNLTSVFTHRRFKLIGIFVALGYALTYMYLTGNIVYLPDFDTKFTPVPSINFADDWIDKVWRLRAPANWEPIVAAYPVAGLIILLPIPNLIIAVLLSLLFGANISLALYRLMLPKACVRGSTSGILGVLPSFLTGFGCCVPTAALALGASFVGAFLAVGNFLLPTSIAILAFTLIWNASRGSLSEMVVTVHQDSG